MAVDQLFKLNMTWVLSRLHVQILRFPFWRERIHLETWPSGKKGKFATRDFLIYDHKKNVVKVYHSRNKYSEKLACLVLNNMLDNAELNIFGANIIPGVDLISEEDKIAVLVEVSNIQIEKDRFVQFRFDPSPSLSPHVFSFDI